MIEQEIWKDCIGYEDYYQVSNFGNVRSKDRIVNNSQGGTQRLIKGIVLVQVPYCGYNTVCFCVAGKIKQKIVKVHRLVAQLFISNPQNKPCVNHKDGNKLNNRLDNLEWVTYSENMKHALNTGLRKRENNYKSRIVIDYNTGVFFTVREAADCADIKYRTLVNKLQNNKHNRFSYV